MDKNIQRSMLLSTRKKQPKHEILSKSECIVSKIKPFLTASMKVGIYLPILGEVDLTSLSDVATCYVPKVKGEQSMDFIPYFKDCNLETSKFGILEPVSNHKIEPNDLDVIIVPMVGFDPHMNRLGFGKGYYDRYLATSNAQRIGVAFDFQKLEHIETNALDQKMDKIITESTIFD